jgi:hypothetical protein
VSRRELKPVWDGGIDLAAVVQRAQALRNFVEA